MRTLTVFNNVSIDGYFVDANGDMSWAHNLRPDPEWQAFIAGNASGSGELLFGRKTYEMMASFWPTPAATQRMKTVADGMNSAPKVVFSRTLSEATWQNTRLPKGDLVTEVRKLKQEPGGTMCILGSGTIVSQLADAGLIDEYQIVVTPVVLGRGRSQFDRITQRLNFNVVAARTFANGNVLLNYAPVK